MAKGEAVSMRDVMVRGYQESDLNALTRIHGVVFPYGPLLPDELGQWLRTLNAAGGWVRACGAGGNWARVRTGQ